MRMIIKVIIVVCICVKHHSCSFQWKEPTLNYTGAAITGYQAYLGLQSLELNAMGSGVSTYDVRYLYFYIIHVYNERH